uniref:Peptidyl-prolyl cis-trans isomerase FKBP20-2, chloroplastic n=1 Tax=Noccaea caerulescens TaxID=107243 RepID=A0A1J3DQC9_NOCCA
MVTILSNPTFLCERLSLSLSPRISQSRSKSSVCCSLSEEPKFQSLSRRRLVYVLVSSPCLIGVLPSFAKTKSKSPYDERRLLEQNKRIQRENNAPDEFPNFVREGFEVKVVASDNYIKADSGLIYRDFSVGEGDSPKDGQQVTFSLLRLVNSLSHFRKKAIDTLFVLFFWWHIWKGDVSLYWIQ